MPLSLAEGRAVDLPLGKSEAIDRLIEPARKHDLGVNNLRLEINFRSVERTASVTLRRNHHLAARGERWRTQSRIRVEAVNWGSAGYQPESGMYMGVGIEGEPLTRPQSDYHRDRAGTRSADCCRGGTRDRPG